MANYVKDRLMNYVIKPYVEETRKSGGRHPSSASVKYKNGHGEVVTAGKCLRQQYYQQTGAPQEERVDFGLTMKARAGDVWSDYFAERIKEAGFWMGDEVRFYNEQLNLSGRVDAIVREEGTNKKVGVEFKTVGMFTKKGKIKNTASDPLAPGEDHVMQVMLYLYHWIPQGIDKFSIVYVCRDSFEIGEHVVRLETGEDGFHYPVISNDMGVVEWKHLRLEDIITRWQELELAVKDSEVPDRDYEIQYSNTKIKALYDTGRLNKTNKAKVDRAIKKGELTDDGPPAIEGFGDWQCRFCAFATHCYAVKHSSQDVAPEQFESL